MTDTKTSAQTLRDAAALMRERAQARTVLPKGTAHCQRSDHPSRVHGHYGYGARFWCSDFGSPLLSEENMGSRRKYAKPVGSSDTFLLAVADWLDETALRWEYVEERTFAIAVARTYLGEQP